MENIGNSLRKIREGKGLSIEDVEQATKIRGHYIDCIEKGNLDALPGAIYTIGFVRTYVVFLGLEEQEIVAAYKQYFAQNNKEEVSAPGKEMIWEAASKHGHKGHVNHNVANNATPPKPIRTRDRSFGGKFLWVVLFLIIILAVLVLYFIGKDKTPSIGDVPNHNIVDVIPPVQPSVPPEDTGEVTNPDSTTEPPATVYEGVEVEVATTADCWVSVKIDDGSNQDEVIKANETRTYKGQEKISIKYGNSGAVAVMVNGVAQEAIGAGGAVVTKEYTIPN